MKNFHFSLLLFVAVTLLFSGCMEAQKMPPEPSTFVYSENDEMVRQFIYSYFGDVFYVDERLGGKTRLSVAYERAGLPWGYEEFKKSYSDAMGGNVLGVQKLEDGTYRADAIVFNKNGARRDTLNFRMEFDEDGEPFVSEQKVILQQALEFDKEMLVSEFIADSGDLSAEVVKHLLSVNFYTVDGVEVPAFVGRYNLLVKHLADGSEDLVDFSVDPFSTNLPFDIVGFSPDEAYLEYYKQDLGRLFNLYDLETKVKTNIELAGILDKYFWYKDGFLVCTKSDKEFRPVVGYFKVGKWKLREQNFLYPDGLNGFKKDADLWLALKMAGNHAEELGCVLEKDQLSFVDAGSEVKMDLNKVIK